MTCSLTIKKALEEGSATVTVGAIPVCPLVATTAISVDPELRLAVVGVADAVVVPVAEKDCRTDQAIPILQSVLQPPAIKF
jgi:hypothetical protein